MDNERFINEGQLATVKHDLAEAEIAALAARSIVRGDLNEFEDDIVIGCNTAEAMSALKQLHSLREKIIALRSKRDRLIERLGHE